MSSYYYPSYIGGPNYGWPNFILSNWEDVGDFTVQPISIISESSLPGVGRLLTFRCSPYKIVHVARATYTIRPGSGSFISSTGLFLMRDSILYGYHNPDDWIKCEVILTSLAPGGKIQYRVYVSSMRNGLHYDSGYQDTTLDSIDIEYTIQSGVDEGGFTDISWWIFFHNLPGYIPWLLYNGIINNYGSPNFLNDRPDYWRGHFWGFINDKMQTEVFKSLLTTLSRIHIPSGIISSELFGNPSLSFNALGISPNSITSSESWGTPTISADLQMIHPNSIVSSENFGLPIVKKVSTPSSSLPPAEEPDSGDIRLDFDLNPYQFQYGEVILGDRDVLRDPGFETAVLITLGTDKYADDDDPLPDDGGYRGGWFGDSIPPVPDYKMGTKLWLLRRSKTEREIPARAKEYLLDGFKWMIDDGIIEKIEVNVERRRDLNTTLAFTLSFIKPEGNTIFYKFYYNWEEQLIRR